MCSLKPNLLVLFLQPHTPEPEHWVQQLPGPGSVPEVREPFQPTSRRLELHRTSNDFKHCWRPIFSLWPFVPSSLRYLTFFFFYLLLRGLTLHFHIGNFLILLILHDNWAKISLHVSLIIIRWKQCVCVCAQPRHMLIWAQSASMSHDCSWIICSSNYTKHALLSVSLCACVRGHQQLHLLRDNCLTVFNFMQLFTLAHIHIHSLLPPGKKEVEVKEIISDFTLHFRLITQILAPDGVTAASCSPPSSAESWQQ